MESKDIDPKDLYTQVWDKEERSYLGCVNYAGEYRISPEAGDVSNILTNSFDDNDLGCRMSLVSRFRRPWKNKVGR